jgi:hypothetical protein
VSKELAARSATTSRSRLTEKLYLSASEDDSTDAEERESDQSSSDGGSEDGEEAAAVPRQGDKEIKKIKTFLQGFHYRPSDFLDPVVWFNHRPPRDRRSGALKPAHHTQLETVQWFCLREEKRRRKLPVSPEQLSHVTILEYWGKTEQDSRSFAEQRGNFHCRLLETRFELLCDHHDLQRACRIVIETLRKATVECARLRIVKEQVEAIASHDPPNDDTIHRILKVVEYELLPSGDADEAALLAVVWHPNSPSPSACRTAYELLSRLSSLAKSVLGSRPSRIKDKVLSLWRHQVQEAAKIPGLYKDGMTGMTLPDRVFKEYCTTAGRRQNDSVDTLLKRLQEDKELGMSYLSL